MIGSSSHLPKPQLGKVERNYFQFYFRENEAELA
jgi:hypothetical protein